jgi:hypothetical protein
MAFLFNKKERRFFMLGRFILERIAYDIFEVTIVNDSRVLRTGRDIAEKVKSLPREHGIDSLSDSSSD